MRLLTIIFCFILYGSNALAHSGGLNSSGCHSGSKPYHCHRAASDMTKSSSGGYRLKCSEGSRSQDCVNQGEGNSVKVPKVENYAPKTNEAIGDHTNQLDADGPAITMLGFNYDQTFEETFATFVIRFGCNSFSEEYCLKDDSKPITWSRDTMGQITKINFTCATFSGCQYTREEIYEAIQRKYELVGDPVDGNAGICGVGVAGEKICVTSYKHISIYKHQFRLKPINFD